MPDKLLRYSGSFCSTVSFAVAILHLGLFLVQLSCGVGQHCEVINFEKFSFHRPPENIKNGVFKKFHSGESCVFGHRFHQIGVDGRPIHKE